MPAEASSFENCAQLAGRKPVLDSVGLITCKGFFFLAGAVPSRRSLMFPQMDLKILALFGRFCTLDWWSLCLGLVL